MLCTNIARSMSNARLEWNSGGSRSGNARFAVSGAKETIPGCSDAKITIKISHPDESATKAIYT